MADNDAAPDQKLKQLSIPHLFAMLSSNFANGMLMASYMLLTLPMEAELIDQDWRSVVLGSLMFIAGLTQLVNPLGGLASDRSMCRWGRRRPFILGGATVGLVGILGQAFASAHAIWVLYYISFGIFMLSLNVASAAAIGLLPDLVPREQLGTATGIAALETVVGASAAFIGFQVWPSLPGLYTTYVVVIVATTTITMFSAREQGARRVNVEDRDGGAAEQTAEGGEYDSPLRGMLCGGEYVAELSDSENSDDAVSDDSGEADAASACIEPRITWKDLLLAYWIDPYEHRDFSFVFWSRTFYYMGISVQVFFKYFVRDIIGSEDPEAVVCKLALVSQAAAAITAVPCGLMSDRIGGHRKRFVYGACVVMAAGYIVTILFVHTEFQFLVVCGFVGAANGVYLAMDQAIAVDTLPNEAEAARFLGVWGIGCFLGGAAGPVLGGAILKACGHVDGGHAYNHSGYVIICLLAALYFIISGVLLIPVKKAK